jgi:hypothetical protein
MNKRYSFKAVLNILADELDIPAREEFTTNTNPRHLHVWIGERYLADTGRFPHGGALEDYTEKDVRRAVAYGKFQKICGAGIGKEAAIARERIREVASWHTDGWITVLDFDVTWTDEPRDVNKRILEHVTFAVVSCYVTAL